MSTLVRIPDSPRPGYYGPGYYGNPYPYRRGYYYRY
jgi:hypothetical protein